MIRRIIFFTLLLLAVMQLYSQRSTSSPYSIFGSGEEFGTRTVEQISMGSIGAAYSSNRYLNFVNPAAVSKLLYTTYSFGLLNSDLKIKDANTNQSSTSTSLSYVALGVPIFRGKIGFIAGMQPTSAVGYSLLNATEDSDGDILDLTQYTGDGSVNRVYSGLGFKISKDFSAGFEVDFLFGNIENSILNIRRNVALATKNQEILDVRGASIKAGIQYHKNLKNDMNISAGVAFKLSNTLRFTGNEYLYSLTLGRGGAENPRDTLFTSNLKGRLNRPLKTTIGVGLGKTDKWLVSLDYKFQDRLDVKGFLTNSSQTFRYGKSSRISFGGFFLPKINSISSYWERVTYRAGLKYEKTGLLVNGIPTSRTFTDVNDFGISFGLGLPIGKRVPSNVNFAFEYGRRGTTNNGLLKENYFNIRLSLSLNDIWFRKRQID